MLGGALTAIIFDLDGTLVQTREASWELFAEVSAQFGLGVDTPERFYQLFTGNVYDSIDALCEAPEQARQVKQAFIARLRSDYTPPIVPGMIDVVRALAGAFTLAVLSSNAMETIRRILEEHGLAHCFAHVFTGDVEPQKGRSIQRFLTDRSYSCTRRCVPAYEEGASHHGNDAEETILITDTVGDVREALESGIRAAGVSWGMHDADELLAAGAEFVAVWPQELVAYLLPLGDDGQACGLAPAGPSCSACAADDQPARPAGLAAVRDAADLRRRSRLERQRRRRVPPDAAAAAHPAAGSAATTRGVVDAELLAAVAAVVAGADAEGR